MKTIYEKLALCQTASEVERMLRGNRYVVLQTRFIWPTFGMSYDLIDRLQNRPSRLIARLVNQLCGLAADKIACQETHIKKMIALIENSHMNTLGVKEWHDEAIEIIRKD